MASPLQLVSGKSNCEIDEYTILLPLPGNFVGVSKVGEARVVRARKGEDKTVRVVLAKLSPGLSPMLRQPKIVTSTKRIRLTTLMSAIMGGSEDWAGIGENLRS